MQKDPWFTIYESGSKNNKYLGTAFNWPNAWTHYAVIVGSDIGSMYLNGTQSTPSVAQNPIKVTDRKMCYFGNYYFVYLNERSLQLPPDIYFYGDFSITAWVFPQVESQKVNRMLLGCNDVTVALDGDPGCPWFAIQNSNQVVYLNAKEKLTKVWTHLAVTLSQTTATIYLNGTVSVVGTQNAIKTLNRTHCLFGQAIDIIDNVLFFNKSLSNAEILKVMKL